MVGTRFGPTEFMALAGSTGAADFRQRHTELLRATLERALACQTKAVIEIPIDFPENLAPVQPKWQWLHPFR